MKYSIGQLLYCRLDDKKQKGREVLDVRPRRGLWEMPSYKFAGRTDKDVWCPEWMLYTEEEFIREVKSGKLLCMQLESWF